MITKEDQDRLDQIRREVSPLIASWAEIRLKTGMSWHAISIRLTEANAIVLKAALDHDAVGETLPRIDTL